MHSRPTCSWQRHTMHSMIITGSGTPAVQRQGRRQEGLALSGCSSLCIWFFLGVGKYDIVRMTIHFYPCYDGVRFISAGLDARDALSLVSKQGATADRQWMALSTKMLHFLLSSAGQNGQGIHAIMPFVFIIYLDKYLFAC